LYYVNKSGRAEVRIKSRVKKIFSFVVILIAYF
jgi:hypothetical protein